ncbi:hypothetical protein G6F37_001300 [Rhizopus arrhizus]|nr:hypothetical protein G6F38_006280 [Rhizopus arrhizus]KAG1163350.1 hypothetical protein G6F37_001300 [Rhizopus arrhizus]
MVACELKPFDDNMATELVIERFQQICPTINKLTSFCISSETFKKETPKIYSKRATDEEYEKMMPNELLLDTATWFRLYFVGKPYVTMIGSFKKNNESFGIISIVQETSKEGLLQYRIIIRSRKYGQAKYTVLESKAKETLSQSINQGTNRRSLLLPLLSKNYDDNNTRHLMRAAILSVCPTLDLRSFKELSSESTITTGFENDLIKYDELQIPRHYKFGVLSIKSGQTTEESWFSNTGLSKDLEEFLNIIGNKVELKGYKGYAAGLDTKTGESGEHTYISKWKGYDITFHVSALMPLKVNDKQQVLRKSHIGNDIVCIIFVEGNQQFNPNAIQSQLLHVYIIIRPEAINNKRLWRIEVIKHKSISQFGPFIPMPPLFNDQDLKRFFTLKLISAENAALKSDSFFIPNNKARLSLLDQHVKNGLSFCSLEMHSLIEKPKANHTKSHLLCKATTAMEERRELNITTSPSPSKSRSTTLLNDFKKGFLRKKD